MMRILVMLGVFIVVASVIVGAPAGADPGECPDPTASLVQVDATCEWTYVTYQSTTSSSTTHVWTTEKVCEVGSAAVCAVFLSCTKDGVTAWMHQIFMNGVPVGQVCIPEDEEEVDVGGLVIREFKRIGWPKSQLVVQPPGGKTLVNFKTNFYTLNTQAISRHVTVATRKVTIEAFPVSYVFRFGDGSNLGTSSPGRPYPSLDVTHVYQRTGKVGVRVDTTYTGRYRIGDGDWVDIEETFTVPGDGQALRILEAVPQLVLE